MQPKHTLKLTGQGFRIEAAPLTREAFAPFGDVIENPRRDIHPYSADELGPSASLYFNAISANQGSAIKYQHVSHQVNLYDQAPSGRQASAVMNMFVCAARARIPDPPAPSPAPARNSSPGPEPAASHAHGPPPPSTFAVTVLERHPYTTQTFIPLASDPDAHYLVIVAPTLPPTADDPHPAFPVPTALPASHGPAKDYPRMLPGGGMPDLRRLRAFVAGAAQAVTYGAGTWHAPMVALGEQGTAVDFVVVQFANGVGIEDCQEVFLGSEPPSGSGDKGPIVVRLEPVGHGSRGTGARMVKL